MGYSLKNNSNGKSASKTPKWPSLKPLALMSKFIRQLEFLENLEDLYGKCCWRAINILILLKIQNVINSHSFIKGASNLAILFFQCAFSISGILQVIAHNKKNL